MNRRTFGIAVGTAIPTFMIGKSAPADQSPSQISTELVGEFVRKAHFDLDAIRSMLSSEKQLVNCCWDWGDGDYETGLGAAAHTGRYQIAELLLKSGARLDVFAATMLGMSAVVRAVLDAMPDAHDVPGPHGISLLSHAVVGKARSFDLVGFLVSRGADINAQSNKGVTPLMVAASVGHVDAVKFFLERGADKNRKDSKGQLAIDLAKKRKHDRVVSLLSE